MSYQTLMNRRKKLLREMGKLIHDRNLSGSKADVMDSYQIEDQLSNEIKKVNKEIKRRYL